MLDTYALLAHGATANLEEMFTYKGDAQNSMFWSRLKTGGVLPEPEVPFTAKKFLGYLEGVDNHCGQDERNWLWRGLFDHCHHCCAGDAKIAIGQPRKKAPSHLCAAASSIQTELLRAQWTRRWCYLLRGEHTPSSRLYGCRYLTPIRWDRGFLGFPSPLPSRAQYIDASSCECGLRGREEQQS